MSLLSSRKIAASLSVLALSVAAASASADEVPNMYMSSKQLKVVEQVSPDYPRFADMAGVDGYVLVEPVMDNGVAVPVRSNMKFSFVPRT